MSGFFHTGDIGELDAEGRLLIKGRKKEMIVTPQGLNVFPEDVERATRPTGVKDAPWLRFASKARSVSMPS
jgi:long-chain acyl-CoA synthetase